MLRVALGITDLDIGGAERALVDLATRLDRDRFSPVVYCLGPKPVDPAASCVPALESADISVHCLGARRAADAFVVRRQWAELLRQQRPDVLNTFLFHANLVGRFAAYAAGVRCVVSGIRVAEPRRWHRWADRLTSRLVDRYVCVSQAVADFSVGSGGLPRDKVMVIPNGIDLAHYPSEPRGPRPVGLPRDRRLVTFIGRLDRQKGVDWLLEMGPAWLQRLPDCDLLLVGHGPDEGRLRAQAQRLGIADRVHFAGWRPDVPAILAASEILVLPSRWEGMSNVVLQAMASRLPVLATDVEGVRELLGPRSDEQTVAWGNGPDFVERLVAILTADHLAREFVANRERVETSFSIDRVVTAYQNLWSRIS